MYNLCQSMYFEKMVVEENRTNRNENFINKDITLNLSSPDQHKAMKFELVIKFRGFHMAAYNKHKYEDSKQYVKFMFIIV